ncbi:hypothetical protein, partial [Salmonella enterica]|uniref:hypothetical protein n=1 Tax=Salmonella enterica TaxID=28901 RepID=UPI0039F7081E
VLQTWRKRVKFKNSRWQFITINGHTRPLNTKRPMMFIRRFTDKKLTTYIRTSQCIPQTKGGLEPPTGVRHKNAGSVF